MIVDALSLLLSVYVVGAMVATTYLAGARITIRKKPATGLRYAGAMLFMIALWPVALFSIVKSRD